jgi:hypothetical protein
VRRRAAAAGAVSGAVFGAVLGVVFGVVAWPVAGAADAAGAVSAASAPAHELFRLADPRIDEASGIAAGIASHVVYVQNDSGDSARFFALDPTSGATRGTFSVHGARNVDWEDIAVARDAHGTPSVWLADVGDNDTVRTTVQLYRVDEPHVSLTGAPVERSIGPADVWNLRYPDAAHDAETLIVDGAGRAFVVTKSVLGTSGVYEVPPAPGAAVQTMRRVGSVRFAPTSTPGPFGIVGQLAATGGSFGDGLVVIRTYTDAYVWPAPDGVAAALRGPPLRVQLPRQQQGEGVCVSGGALLVDSEGADSPVYAVPFTAPKPAPSTARTTPVSPAPSTSQPVVIAHRGRSSGTLVLLVLLAAGVAFFGIGFAAVGLAVWVKRHRRV